LRSSAFFREFRENQIPIENFSYLQFVIVNLSPMKPLLLLLVVFVPAFALAQGSSMFFPLVKDASYKLVSTNKKGKQSGSEIHKVVSVESVPAGTTATFECSTFDPKDKPMATFTYVVEVNDKTTKIDWRSRLNGIQNAVPAPLMKDGSPCYLELPNNPQIGQTFPDCTIAFEKGKARYEAAFYDIKIVAKESITQNGNSYEAYVLEYGFLTTLKEGLLVKFNKYHRDWYVPGLGLVKSTSANSSQKPKPADEDAFFTALVN
jgi:hypothetical protein